MRRTASVLAWLLAVGSAGPVFAQMCPCPSQSGTNYRSLGDPGILANSGNADVPLNGTTISFSTALPASVGRGDELTFTGAPAETLFVLDRVSAFSVTVHAPATSAHTSQSYEIRRAYNDLPTWENERDGNLVGENRSEVGVAYADSSPTFTASVTFDGSTTDATHTMTLTVPPAQRHAGNANTGVILDASGAGADAIDIRDDHVTIEWLVVKNTDPLQNGVRFSSLAGGGNNQIVVRSCVFDNVQEAALQIIDTDTRADIYNNIVNNGSYGIRMPTLSGASSRLRIWNNSIYNTFAGGIIDAGGANPTVTLENNIVMNTVGANYSVTAPGTANNNTDEDGTAPGANTITTTPATIWQAPGTNFHLLAGANTQVDSGVTVSEFWYDVDAEGRSAGTAWDRGADERHAGATNYRSIGDALDYNAGSITAVDGSPVVDGSGTAWVTANRGRGDRIDIGGTDYTILAVTSETQLTLTTPVMGSHSGAYTISRQFDTPEEWEDCIDNGVCTFFPTSVSSSDLVADDRSEVGIVYADSTFVGPAAGVAVVRIASMTTDAEHTITLTADGDNRHYGIPGGGVVFQMDPTSVSGDVLEVMEPWVTVEWIEAANTPAGSSADGIEVSNMGGAFGTVTVRNNLVHNVDGTCIQIDDPTLSIDVYSNIGYDCNRNGIHIEQPLTMARVLNNTVLRTTQNGIIGTAPGPYPTVLVQNNISHSSGSDDYDVPGSDPATSNNISGDGTAPGGGSFTGVCLSGAGCLNFVSATDLHLQSTSFAIDKGVNLGGTFTGDIDAGIRVVPWDIGADEQAALTAVELSSFTATPGDGTVVLRWITASELNNLGFLLYRATSTGGPYDRITDRLVPGLGSSPSGATYEYRDEGLANGATYFYALEDVETTGDTERHGPVSATPIAGLAPTPNAPTPAARITFGDPGSNELRVLKKNRKGVVLELTTNGFFAEPQEDGTVRVSIPDYQQLSDAGMAPLPIRRAWVEAIEGRKVRVASVRAKNVETITGLAPSGADVELVATTSGTVRAERRLRRLAVSSGLHPESAARLLSVGFQGQTKKALVELAPLRWDADGGRWLLAKKLVVRVSFRGREPNETRRTRRRERAPFARLVTTEKGLHRVPFETIFSRGPKGVSVDRLRLSRQGKSHPFYVDPPSKRFRRGSTLYFVSEGASANPYGHEAVYELEIGRAGELIPFVSAAPSGNPVPYFWTELAREENHIYQAGLIHAPDLWLWDVLVAPEAKSYPFKVENLATTNESSSLEVWLQGTSDLPAAPDHHVRTFVNGSFIGEQTWDGKKAVQLSARVPVDVLREGVNVLEIENAGDTGAAHSVVMLDRFQLRYPSAMPSSLGTAALAGTAQVPESISFILDVTGETPHRLAGIDNGRFCVEAGHSYLMTDPRDAIEPAVRRPFYPRLEQSGIGADYVVIGPQEFLLGVEPLLSHRAGQGLRVMAVSTEQIYSEFGHGETTPYAIQAFLAHAYHNWPRPSLRYALLLGDGTYDYEDFFDTGVENKVPPLMVRTSHLWTASDPAFASVNGNDSLPDLAIGRLPAASIDDVHSMVEKILSYESGLASTISGTIVLVADDPDLAGEFERDADDIASAFFDPRKTRKIYLSKVDSARSEILDAFDGGASIFNYLGHGGIHLWADENVFNIDDVRSLSSQSQQPILLTMNCLNGYFHFPFFDSLAEAIVKIDGKGAIAAFSPSGLSQNDAAHRYHRAVLSQLLRGSHERLGDAILAAQVDYVETGAMPELITIYHLFGDPALLLR